MSQRMTIMRTGALLAALACLWAWLPPSAPAQGKPALGYAVYARAEALLQAEAEGPAAVPRLREALGDPSLFVRRTAAHILARMGEPAWGAMLEALGNEDSEVRRIVAEALFQDGKLGARVLDILADPDPIVRLAAMRMVRAALRDADGGRRTLMRQLAEAVVHPDRNVRRTANEMLDTWDEELRAVVVRESQRIAPYASSEDFEEYAIGDFRGQNPLWRFSLLDAAEVVRDPANPVNPSQTLRLAHRGRTHLPIYECRGWGWPMEPMSGMLSGRFDVKFAQLEDGQWDFFYHSGGSRAGVRFTSEGGISGIGRWTPKRWYRVSFDFALDAEDPQASRFRVRVNALGEGGRLGEEVGRSGFQRFSGGAAFISHNVVWFRRAGQITEVFLDNMVLEPLGDAQKRRALLLELYESDRAAALPLLDRAAKDSAEQVRRTAAELMKKER